MLESQRTSLTLTFSDAENLKSFAKHVVGDKFAINLPSHLQGCEDPITQKVYYRFQESSINYTYTFDMVIFPPNSSTAPAVIAPKSPWITRFFGILLSIPKYMWDKLARRRMPIDPIAA